MRPAEIVDDRRLTRERLSDARVGDSAPPASLAGRPNRHAARRQSTGFEPFLIAALLGLGLWALILTPIFL